MAGRTVLFITLFLLTACAASTDPVPDPKPTEPLAAEEKEPLLDRTQAGVESVVTSTAQAVDNLFGSADVEEEASVTRGRLSVGGQWDRRDGLRERLRLKARFALPALEERT